MKYTPHPDGLEMTVFKIGKLLNVRMKPDVKRQLSGLLRKYEQHQNENQVDKIHKLESEVYKFKEVKRLLRD